MNMPIESTGAIIQLKQWAAAQESVRAMLLTGSLANPNAPTDKLSDFDIVLVVTDIQPYHNDGRWVTEFGDILVAYWDPIHLNPEFSIEQTGNVIQYANGLKLDFTLWPVELFLQAAGPDKLTDELDAGYIVLMDKDNLTAQMPAPTGKAYLPKLPSQQRFHQFVEEFFSDVPYVAKCLWRDELLPVKWCLDHDMKHNYLRPMLEWHIASKYSGSASIGSLGKGLKKKLAPEIWSALENTYTGAGIEENWQALFRTIELFRKIAIDVANSLGFEYSIELDQKVTAYAQRIKDLESSEEPFTQG